MLRIYLAVFTGLLLSGCAARKPGPVPVFRVVKPGPEHALESPGMREAVPFSQLMERQYQFTAGHGYIDVLPGMRITANRAYFSGTEIKLGEYLGAETGRWTVEPGARFRFAGRTAEPALRKPASAPPIEKLIDPKKRRLKVYRLFFQVRWFTGGKDEARGSVILGAPDAAALEAATKTVLAERQPVCGAKLDCIPFPPATTVTAEVGIEVNGERRWVSWGATVRSLAPPSARKDLRVERRAGRVWAPVEFARDNDDAWRFPVLPGDRLHWTGAAGGAAAERVVTSSDGAAAPIAFDTRGKADAALVFIHGWASDRSYWHEQADVFARDHMVVTLDLTGHGPFAASSPPRSVLGLAGDVELVVRDLGARRVILIGHGMGGAVAIAAAKRLRGIAHGVVMVEAPDLPAELRPALEADFKAGMEQWVRSQAGLHGAARDWVLERAPKADAATALNMLRDYAGLDFAALRKDVAVPVQVVRLPEAGYYPQLGKPAEFNEELRKALAAIR